MPLQNAAACAKAIDVGPEDRFLVKAPITDGRRAEVMWVAVTTIEDDVVHGTLEDIPVGLKGPKLGDSVRVSVDEVSDWLYVHEDKEVGGFTRAVLREYAKYLIRQPSG